MERMESISEFYKKRADDYLRLSKAASRLVDYCKDNLKYAMQELDTNELVGNDFYFKLSKTNPKCVIDDEAKIDMVYKREIKEIVVDKKAILEDLKQGLPVVGAKLEESFSLRAYIKSPNKKAKQ
jgi:hypothetical protein